MLNSRDHFKKATHRLTRKHPCTEHSHEFMIPEVAANYADPLQQFYKISLNSFRAGVSKVKHGHRVFAVEPWQLDLVLHCLKMMERESRFPIKVIMASHSPSDSSERNIWIETIIANPMLTEEDSTESRKVPLEKMTYDFFRHSLLPQIRKFKDDWLNFERILDEAGDEEDFIAAFHENVIEWGNREFSEIVSSHI